jgi:DNA-binding NarL/FixJ family response regulator
VRVLLASGHALFCQAVGAALRAEPDFDVLGEALDGLEAVGVAARTEPDVAVLDVDLPTCGIVQATALIRERVPGCRVMVLADAEDEELLVDVVDAGASGYMIKGTPLTELMEALRALDHGEAAIPVRMLGGLLDRLTWKRRQDGGPPLLSRLTPREREVLALLVEGGDNGSIARALVISPQTARTHIQNVMVKLGAHSRLEAVALALREGILVDA